MSYTNQVSEVMYPLATHHPLTRQSATHVSNWVSLANYHRAWFFLDAGVFGQGTTVNAGLQQATSVAGAGAKAIAGKTITVLTKAGADDNSLDCIELQTEELDVDGRFEFVRFYVTIAGGDVGYSATLFGVEPRFAPVPTTNWNEIVDK
jgi:hypothetical protein